MMRPAAEDSLWRFAVDVYGADGVSEDCLWLQDRYDADIPVLLCALWMARRGNGLDAATMNQMAGAVTDWHREVVKPLRAVRQRMKHGPAPAPDKSTEAIRDVVKGAELAAEKVELAVLAAFVAERFPTGAPVDPRANLMTALEYYSGSSVGRHVQLDHLVAAASADKNKL